MKALPGKAVNAGMRIAGAAGAGYLSNKVIGTKVNPKLHGLIFLSVGLAGELFLEDEKLNSLAQGITTMGGLQVISKNLLPNEAASFGLSGEDEGFDEYEELEGLEGFDDTPEEYLEGIEEVTEMLSGDNFDYQGAAMYTPEELEAAASI